MRTVHLVFGPDYETGIARALERMEGLKVTVEVAGPEHADDVKDEDVLLLHLYHPKEFEVTIPGKTFEELIFEFRVKAYDSSYAILDRNLNLQWPKGKPITKLVVFRESDDYATLQTRWTADHYYPTMTSKKLSGKKINLKG